MWRFDQLTAEFTAIWQKKRDREWKYTLRLLIAHWEFSGLNSWKKDIYQSLQKYDGVYESFMMHLCYGKKTISI